MPGKPHVEEDDVRRVLAAWASPSSAVAATATRYFSRSNARRSAQAIGSSSSMIRMEGMGALQLCGGRGDSKAVAQSYTILPETTVPRATTADTTTAKPASSTGDLVVTRTLATLMTALAAPAQSPPNRRRWRSSAHRGASFDAPENTVAAIKLAWEQKADAAEFDVYLSKDGKIVVIHDATTKRTAGVDRKVVEPDARRTAEARRREVEGREVRRREDPDAGGDAGDRAGRQAGLHRGEVRPGDRAGTGSRAEGVQAQAGADAGHQLQRRRGRGGEEGPAGPARRTGS